MEHKLELILELGKKMDKAGVRLYAATHMPGKSDEQTIRRLDRCLLLWMEFNKIVKDMKFIQQKKNWYFKLLWKNF